MDTSAKKKMARAAAAALAAAGLAAAADSRLMTTVYTVRSPRIHVPLRLALICDLHSCRYGEDQSELIKVLRENDPDAVIFGGDIFEYTRPEEPLPLIWAASNLCPSYFVSGNHEYWQSMMPAYRESLRKAGVAVLEGDCVRTRLCGETINICGAEDPVVIGTAGTRGQIIRARKAADMSCFTLLASHRPMFRAVYAGCGFDLVLCGHAHGGQWRVPGLLNGLYSPDEGLFPEYAGGMYDIGERTVMIVSRGLARRNLPVPRIFNRPEAVFIDVVPR